MKYLLIVICLMVSVSAHAGVCVMFYDMPVVQMYKDQTSKKPFAEVSGKKLQSAPWMVVGLTETRARVEQVGTTKKFWVDKRMLRLVDPDECEYGG